MMFVIFVKNISFRITILPVTEIVYEHKFKKKHDNGNQ